MRTARFEGRDAALVQCQYNGLKCGVKGGGKGKGKHPSQSASEDSDQDASFHAQEDMVNLERTVKENLIALPRPSTSSSTSSLDDSAGVASASASASAYASTSTSTSFDSPPTPSSAEFGPSVWYPSMEYTTFPYYPSQLPSSHQQFLSWTPSLYPVPASPDSYHSAESYYSTLSYENEYAAPLSDIETPPEQLYTSGESLSLPLFPLPRDNTKYNDALLPSGQRKKLYWPEEPWLGNSHSWTS
ncbi:hypothetical protein P7C70_g2890, partial [Phenoliferia sp. Uapishka_3]